MASSKEQYIDFLVRRYIDQSKAELKIAYWSDARGCLTEEDYLKFCEKVGLDPKRGLMNDSTKESL